MENGNLKRRAFVATLWRVGEVGGRQLLSLIVTTILARLIYPEQYGLIAMLSIFMAVADTFIDSGVSTALIRKNNRTQADCSTVFYFNLSVSLLAYVILFFSAPLIARFYEMPELQAILRVSALALIINAVGSIQRTLLSAELNFKLVTQVNLVSMVVAGVVGIFMAYHGFQVWALVCHHLTLSIVGTVLIYIFAKWRPTLEFSWASLREFFGFGSKILASALLNTVYTNSYSLVIGKFFSSATLAFYNRAGNFGNLASSVPTTILESVTFPALCKLQDNDDNLRNGYRRMLRLATFVVFPACLGLGAVAYPMIAVLLTERWIFAATLLQIIVFGRMWYPVHSINLNLLKVKGRSDLFFRLEVIKKILGVAMLCITVPLGIKAMCYGSIVNSLIALVINTHYTGRLISLGIVAQMRDYLPSFILSVAMFAVVVLIVGLLGNTLLSLVAGIIVGVLFYLGGSWLFRFPELRELRGLRKS